MYTPDNPQDDPEENQLEGREPFPEPQTIPDGWDVSGMISEPASAEMEVGSED